jgi:molybdenum cofactor cytidylyltransferase
MFFAIIPAAGHSTRMGRPKLSLPLGDRTVIEWTVGTLRQLPSMEVLVVLGPHTADLAPLARIAGAHVVTLAAATPDMRATVEHGLVCCEQQFHPQSGDQWLLCPADLPIIDASAIEKLTSDLTTTVTIRVPTYAGRRGHPTLVSWGHVDEIFRYPRDRGLNQFFREKAAETLEVPVETNAILLDLDTPEDYEKLQRLVDSGRITPPRRLP